MSAGRAYVLAQARQVVLDWLCFRLYLILPVDSRLAWAVLPRAGRYAWRDVKSPSDGTEVPW